MKTLGEGQIDWNKDGSVLNVEQRRFYEKNGYLVVKKCVAQSELDRYIKRFREICLEGKGRNISMIISRDITIAGREFKAAEQEISKLQNWQDDLILFEYCKTPAIVNIVKDLVGNRYTNLCAMHTMLINKPPDTGSLTSRHPLHQDLEYFPIRPADFITCAWTAMETVNRANGCLVVVPGSHKGTHLPHEYPNWEGGVNKGYHGIRDFDPNWPRTYVEMDAGDTVFFHPLIIHGSGANRTKGFRKAISCHYANDDLCAYHNNLTTTQEETSKDVVDMVAHNLSKQGIEFDRDNFDFIHVWKYKSRPVYGIKSNL